MIKEYLYRLMLPILIANACESRIPRSGEKGQGVNCFVVAIDRESSPYFLATSYENKKLTGLIWNHDKYSDECSLDISELKNGELRVTHFYGLAEVTYNNIYDIVWHYFTKMIYLKINLYRHIDTTHQYFFNKRKFFTKKRMDLLQFMINDQLDRTHKGIGAIDLMTKLYSIKWVLHPSADEQQEKLELYLDSLVESGELEKINSKYIVTGKSISTVERYEEQERKHTEAVKLQKKMFWLTVVIALVAAVQAGIIKLPTLLNLSIESTHLQAVLARA